MKIELRVSISGTRNGVEWPRAGTIIDLPDAEAADLCASGAARPVADRSAEKAVPPTVAVETRDETPVTPAPAKRTAPRRTK